ncbi:MAG: hypothetical protein DWQ18_01025 [Crenarchaeota archaeon]|nr:MAG: hypothetical protein DWQ17_04190 [Thermoproteota archaeon]RDJ34553.1 MAG: hypothetical protein DWQ18_01025 [Thermoproteota archaeon]RDJ35927.1 MAG: hypothetical protein DWQ19_08560 [Thermoproteota archaeon]RDJ38504.1 MAG: hypothetical protein DWQ13_03795 [Thermoproteota archaeon]
MTQQITTDSIQVVTFSLINSTNNKKEDYAIPIEQVKEIRTLEEITKIPKAKSYVRGIMNLRGLIIPVIDVKDKLGFGTTEISSSSKQRILVADVHDSLYGLLVDDVDQVLRISSNDIGAPPPGAFDSYNYVKGIAKTNQKLLVLIDVIPLIQDAADVEIPKSEPKESKPEVKKEIIQNETKTEEISDDIPDELKSVFEEDASGTPPTEIIRNEEADTTADFQTRVDQESEKIFSGTLRS